MRVCLRLAGGGREERGEGEKKGGEERIGVEEEGMIARFAV